MTRERGFTLIELMIVVAIIALIMGIALPNLLVARKSANETNAIGALKTINTSEMVYREGDKEHDGNIDYGMLTELSNVALVDAILGAGIKAGYNFSCTYSYASSEFIWFGIANPSLAQSTGDRYFATNPSGVIFYTTDGNFLADTLTCTLPRPGCIPVSK